MNKACRCLQKLTSHGSNNKMNSDKELEKIHGL